MEFVRMESPGRVRGGKGDIERGEFGMTRGVDEKSGVVVGNIEA
jgi:hypothetical protein